MSEFSNVKSAKVRAYLNSDKSTTLDKAGSMIDIAILALDADERNHNIDVNSLYERRQAIEEAEFALGLRDSLGVRYALRHFWSI